MAAILDVWIAKPGDACLVDDDEWLVTVDDPHGLIFEWAGTTYANLPAPHAHWAGTIPPGCYVVHAVNARTGATTDHTITTVGCTGDVCVRLFVSGKEGEPPPPDCKIKIKEVSGAGQPIASAIKVTGAAAGCQNVRVTVTCASGLTQSVTVAVSSGGTWTATIDAGNLRCICGKPATVIAQCVEHRECKDELRLQKLQCLSD